MKTGKILKSAVAIAALTGTLATSAFANTISLDTGNSGISGYTGPYGSVTVTWIDSTHAGITFTALDNGYHFLFGDGGSVALNVNGTIDSAAAVASITTATGPQQGANAPGPWTFSPGNEDGWG